MKRGIRGRLARHLGEAAVQKDLERYVGEVPPAPRISFLAKLARYWALSVRSFPALVGLVEACRGFRNIDRTPPRVAQRGAP